MSQEKEVNLYVFVADPHRSSASLRFPENGASAARMAKEYDWEPPHRKHIDNEKVRIQREARDKIPYLLEHGTEEEFVSYVKSWKKGDLTKEDLQEWIRLFHACRAERRGF